MPRAVCCDAETNRNSTAVNKYNLFHGWEFSSNALVARTYDDGKTETPDSPPKITRHKNHLQDLLSTSSPKQMLHQRIPTYLACLPSFRNILMGTTSHLRRLHQTAFYETERPKSSQCSTHRARSTLLPHRRSTHGHPAETWCAYPGEHALPTTHEYSKPPTSQCHTRASKSPRIQVESSRH